MRPVLFEIFNAEVRSYYALWAFALFLLVVDRTMIIKAY